MNKQKQQLDIASLVAFLPAVLAMAIIPILMRAVLVSTKLIDDIRYFKGILDEESKIYYMADIYSQCKALAVVVFAVIMLVVAAVCCKYMFRYVEKRSFVYVGASVVYVLMSLASALGSQYSNAAFFGVFDRAEGFFTTACYFVLFLFTMYAFRKTQNFSYIVAALMICTGVNIIIGLFQYTGHNLFLYDWFASFNVTAEFREMMELNIDAATEAGTMYGALYHYNYVGSFMGMTIPMFTVLAIYGKTIFHKIIFALFSLGSIFMLLASSARSGIVAIIAAAVVALVVFGRLLISRWKITLAIVGGAAVLLVGANFALDNALFRRIPSIFEDVVDMVAPADDDADLFSELPVREIKHNKDGSITLITQKDAVTIAFDEQELDYNYTDSQSNEIPLIVREDGTYGFDDDRFSDINFEWMQLDTSVEQEYNDMMALWFGNDTKHKLTFILYNYKQLHLIDTRTGERFVPENAEAIGFKGKEKLGSSRGYIWSRTLPLLKDCILIGYGADTYAYVFPQNDILAKYYSYAEGFFITVDKPHNLYIQLFFSHGLIALIAFIVICAVYLIDCFRLYALKKSYRIEQIYGISIMLGVVGYLAAGLFNDSVVSVAPVFWILLGVGAALNTINRRMDRSPEEAEEDEPELVTAVDTQIRSAKKDEQLEQEAAALLAKINTQREEQKMKKSGIKTKADLEALRANINAIKVQSTSHKENSDDE